MRFNVGSSLLIMLIVFVAACPTAAFGQVVYDIDSIFSAWNKDKVPGCAIAVAQNGVPISVRGYGMADIEHNIRITPDTIFEAGSVSKQFTAAAILKLIEARKLSLDTDVRAIIPELPDYGTTITIDQLMNHTSGLRDWGGVVRLAGWPRTSRVYSQKDALKVITKQKSLNFEPGTESSYTNSGYNLLTEIVFRVSGKSLAEFSQDTLFRPLGMRHTRWRDNFRDIVIGRAQAYEWGSTGYFQEMPFENTYGNGGLLTTVGDLLIWNKALDDGVLGTFVTTKLSERSKLRDGRQLTYGRGLFNYTFKGVEEISHAGSTAGYRAWLGRYPSQKLSVAMLCNAGNAPTTLGRDVAARFLPKKNDLALQAKSLPEGLFVDQATGAVLTPQVYQSTKSRIVSKNRIELTGRDNNIAVYLKTPALVGSPISQSDYFGKYESDEVGAIYTIGTVAGGLMWRIEDKPDFEQKLVPIYEDAFRGDDAILRFVRNESGRVIALTVGIERARRIEFKRQTDGL